MGTRFVSLFVQVGYRIINGDKLAVTGVEKVYDPKPDFPRTMVKDRDWSFFYSASGLEIRFGLSINLL